MKVKVVLSDIINFGKENKIPSILNKEKVLRKIINRFGRQDTANISIIELASFLKKELGINKISLKEFFKIRRKEWDNRYYLRYHSGKIALLPWESEGPNSALVNLFKQRIFLPKNVLELGCGVGLDALFMAGKGCRVTAVDISHLAIKLARSKAKRDNIACNFLNKSIFDLRQKNFSFDFVFDRGCFHHLPFFFYQEYRERVAKLLTAKGYFQLICHNPKVFPTKYLYPYLGSLTKVIDLICEGRTESFFTATDLRTIFSESFQIIRLDIIPDDMQRPLQFISCLMIKRS